MNVHVGLFETYWLNGNVNVHVGLFERYWLNGNVNVHVGLFETYWFQSIYPRFSFHLTSQRFVLRCWCNVWTVVHSEPSQTSTMEFFHINSRAPPWMFEWVLNSYLSGGVIQLDGAIQSSGLIKPGSFI